MKWVARRFAWLLPLVLCACAHNMNQTQMQSLAPPLEEMPAPPPDLAPTTLPATPPNIPQTKEPVAVPPEPVKAVPKHHKPSLKAGNAAQASAAPAPQSPAVTEAAPPAAPAEESASGKFGTPEGADSQKQAESTIADVERGLNGIGRKLSDQETKTSTQIREYLKEARTILATGDVAGAQMLATKAKALLGELSQ